MEKTILVVTDAEQIRHELNRVLRAVGYAVIEVFDRAQALQSLRDNTANLTLIATSVASVTGSDLCREIRRQSTIPLIILSEQNQEADRVLGLELGADDYIGNPFDPRELVARVRALIRRCAWESTSKKEEAQEVQHGALRINLDTHQTWWQNCEVQLTATEFQMLHTMVKRPGHVFSRDSLIEGSYRHHAVVCDRTVDSHLRSIRQKFRNVGGNPVDTVHGVGYKINQCRSMRLVNAD